MSIRHSGNARAILFAAIALLLASCNVTGRVANPRATRFDHAASSSPFPAADSNEAAAPFTGRFLIADRGNNRLLVVDASKNLQWVYPSRSTAAPPGGFYFPDDAFFTSHGTGIISNEEENHVVVRITFPSGNLVWSYGHPRAKGWGYGFLNQPDDAYLLRSGSVMVADAANCRVLIINQRKVITNEIGTTRYCVHHPPNELGYPNGDTPLPDGNILVSEIDGSYVDEITPTGKLLWSVHLPVHYPSDPQQVGPDRYLLASYTRPGAIIEFTHTGRILFQYRFTSGPKMLDHPSLAEMLPGGLIATTDDYRDRVVIIDPKTKTIVWQYGHTDKPGGGPGYINLPDGFDLLTPDGTTPTHPFTG
ncbi:MAG: NHL repeat-containing protein [Actinomycetota bacterium]